MMLHLDASVYKGILSFALFFNLKWGSDIYCQVNDMPMRPLDNSIVIKMLYKCDVYIM